MAADGWRAEKIFDGAAVGFAYDDLVIMPKEASFEASDVDLTGRVTRDIKLQVPLLAAPSATAAGHRAAAALALAGGLGVIHCRQAIGKQVEMVRKVKERCNGFILDPPTLGLDQSLKDFDKLRSQDKEVECVCITEGGQFGGKLLGLVSMRDAEFVENRETKLSKVMVKKLVTGKESLSLQESKDMLKREKVGTLPIVDEEGRLVAMLRREALMLQHGFPKASKDLNGQLLVGAAVAAGGDGCERATALCQAGVDVLYVNALESMGSEIGELIRKVKAEFPRIQVLGGPAGSCRDAKRLMDAGADGVVAGDDMPPSVGSLAAVGRMDATAIYQIARYMRLNYEGSPVVAGGGIRNSGQALKALCLGASAVMLSDPLQGTEESPGGTFLQASGAVAKLGTALEPVRVVAAPLGTCGDRTIGGPSERWLSPAEPVKFKGSVAEVVAFLVQGLRNGMQDVGARSLSQLHDDLESGELRFECRNAFSVQAAALLRQAVSVAPRPEIMPLVVPSGVGPRADLVVSSQ